ncbi:MAG TPA: LacI family DNA-binding transcriptional regulator [Mycobacteriales bacterium]|jgi:DNA-binding LacI/PurR family transcriptional regulator|nr:LacI family DNA-binding transcriptional regulator [Mycobacteriales bacterium]
MTTIADVARKAGVSKATASRAFSRPEAVRADTRERVLAVARDLAYTPSPVARSLSTGRTGNLGLFVPDISNPFFGPLMKAVQSEAKARGFALFVADSDEHTEDEEGLVRAIAAQVDGLVLASPRMSDDQLRSLHAQVPLVVINRSTVGVPGVLVDSAQGMTQAVEHLVALGHRRATYLAGPADSFSATERRASLTAAAARHGLEVVELGPVEPRFSAGVRGADLALATGATAVLAYNDLVALGLMQQLVARGLRVGPDVSVVGFDDIWLAPMTTPPLTTVCAPGAAAGTAAVRLLTDPSGAGRSPGSIRLPTELVVRQSTGPAPRR